MKPEQPARCPGTHTGAAALEGGLAAPRRPQHREAQQPRSGPTQLSWHGVTQKPAHGCLQQLQEPSPAWTWPSCPSGGEWVNRGTPRYDSALNSRCSNRVSCQARRSHGGSCISLSAGNQSEKPTHGLFPNVAFRRRQNQADSKRARGCPGSGEEDDHAETALLVPSWWAPIRTCLSPPIDSTPQREPT